MIAARIAPDMRMALIASPAYLERRPLPKTPQDLTAHLCINLRMTTAGGIYAWELEKDGREIAVRVEGQLTFNSIYEALDAALRGSASPSCRKTSPGRTSRPGGCVG